MKLSASSPSRMEVSGGPGTASPGRYVCNHCPLKFLIRTAYGVGSDNISGPSWIETEQYDLMANIAPHTDKAQFQKLLRNLLAERVALRVRRITKEQAGFDLTVGAHGARLKPSPSPGDADVSAAHRAPTVTDSEGFPILPHGSDGPLTVPKNEGSVVHLYTRANQSMDQLAEFLRRTLKAPVRNSTGLAGKYEIRLSYEVNTSNLLLNGEPMAAPGAGGATDPQVTASTLAASLDRRLGLKLVPAKVDVDTIVVEHVEKRPAGN